MYIEFVVVDHCLERLQCVWSHRSQWILIRCDVYASVGVRRALSATQFDQELVLHVSSVHHVHQHHSRGVARPAHDACLGCEDSGRV